jgi:uncharacterized protein YkwD
VGLSNVDYVQALETAEATLREQYDQIRVYQKLLVEANSRLAELSNLPSPTPVTVVIRQPTSVPVGNSGVGNFTGEELMQAVNKYRREHGVPELQLHSGLCQLASRRLGELLNLGSLDNHAGFEAYFGSNEISDLSGPSLTNVAENLASGYPSAWDTVMGWDSSPPHRTFLLADGAYKHGCGAANQGFAVLIGGY